ncbi:vitamin K epoxide reductase family protein [Chitinophaga nivalis]|uniref:Thioredoxin domain-containing protein n=1 Tax=Chitinophaga nivalis TaxID=2991709 RepID=A0ABT3IUP8_9BACT|nr:vitamin K epoxide reductase family protein [Chitinophaga nivalis]MCW3462592.1 thioredoxin domain-containing protein [Chitinophaga nivalis]MCW3487717.1 thioredoxin domain-containing protein [Chitinophaga nivalis]
MKKQAKDDLFEDIAWRWLRSNKINVDKKFMATELQTHPDYPSLVSLTDFLEVGGMQYYAIESEWQYVSQFNYPLLAHVKEEHTEYMLQVDTIQDWTRNKDLEKGWTGIVLIPEENTSWHNEENTRQLKQNRSFNLMFAGFLALLLGVVGYIFHDNFTPLNIIWGLLSLAGLAISTATIATELGVQIKVVKEVCNSVSPRGCDAVLKSKYATGLWGITVADAAITYFGVQFGCFLLSNSHPLLFATIQMIALPLTAVALVSVYAQKFILKRWCALCLGIVAILVVQGILAAVSFQAFYPAVEPLTILYFFIAQAICCAFLIPLKKSVKSIREQLSRAMELQRWKRDSSLFIAQWSQQPAADITPWEHELQYGNPEAPIDITVACSPHCGPCTHAHKMLDELYELYKDTVRFKVRFVCSPGETNQITTSVTAILQRATVAQSSDDIPHMLSDWFTMGNVEKWTQKWDTSAKVDVTDQLKRHSAWIDAAGVKGTPTVFINGRQLPKNYQLQDMTQLIPALAETSIALQHS